jgi:protein phosphatase
LYEKQVHLIHQLTADHSLVNELIRRGQLAVEEAASHPHRNVLTRALGTDVEVELEMNNWMWNEGDRLLLCSDGLSNMVDSEQLLAILADPSDVADIPQKLIQAALKSGGDDNITVALISNDTHDQAEQGGE